MAKSPINILQEYCVKEFNKYPNYVVRDASTANNPQFSCDCGINNIITTCVASSKIMAKTKAADCMIAKLRIQNVTLSNSMPLNKSIGIPSNGNYVGSLNEYCSQNGMPYPEYKNGIDGLQFIVQCTHNNFSTNGKGQNKKSAKQESAKAMLELLNTKKEVKTEDILDLKETPSSTSTIPSNNSLDSFSGEPKPDTCEYGATAHLLDFNTTMLDGDDMKPLKNNSPFKSILSPILPPPICPSTQRNDDEVVSLYKKFSVPFVETPSVNSLSKSNQSTFFNDNNSAISNAQKDYPSLHEKLEQNGIKYEITILQKRDPYVVGFIGTQNINGETVTKNFLEIGDSVNVAIKKLLMFAIESFKL